MGKYHVWSDDDSYVSVPDKLYNEVFETGHSAYNSALDFVHQYDGEPYKVIAHIEDIEKGVVVDSVENFPF